MTSFLSLFLPLSLPPSLPPPTHSLSLSPSLPLPPSPSLSLLRARLSCSECEVFLPPERLGDFVSELRPLRGLHDIEIAQRLLGHGGERNAFLMRFLASTRFTTPDEEWVVKESRHTRTHEEEVYFHRKALVTQKAAEELANRFNAEAEGLGLVGLPKVSTRACASCVRAYGRSLVPTSAVPLRLPSRLSPMLLAALTSFSLLARPTHPKPTVAFSFCLGGGRWRT